MSKKIYLAWKAKELMWFLNLSLHKELTCVNFRFVLLKIFYICVRISTHFTDKWSFTCMGPKMFIELPRGNKTLFTNATDIWLLSCVLAGVRDERAGHGEGFAAAVTHVGLLARVPPHVVRQRAGLGEALPAAVAHVRLLPAVLPGMDLQVARGCKLQVADITFVRLLLSMVHPAVEHQLALLGKAFVAQFTLVWLLPW